MEFFRDSSFDFMGKRRFFIALSILAVLASIFVLATRGFNLGIDFAGGTQLILKFQDEPDVEQLRAILADAGFDEAGIQAFGEDGDNQVIVRTPLEEGREEGTRGEITAALDAVFNAENRGKFDLNQEGTAALSSELRAADPDGVADDASIVTSTYYDEVAAKVMSVRRSEGIVESWDQLRAIEGVSPEVIQAVEERSAIGAYAVSGGGNVSPQIGSELRQQGILAVLFSMIGMLAYIWLRFELRFGVGAVVAIFHDVIICLGLYSLMHYEFNLTTIAAFLTVVGYSVNDTVVVFDRVRENLRRTRRDALVKVLNTSLNQTLSRTVLTSGTTLLVVICLFVLGGDGVRGLAFILMTGVIIGTYSSIFVASPVVIGWERFFGRDARAARKG